MHKILKSGTILAAAFALGGTGALAQTNGNSNGNAGNNSNGAANVGQAAANAAADNSGKAKACRQQLTNLTQQMRSDGLWISGWGTPYGYGYGPAAPVSGLAAANVNGNGAGANGGGANAGGNGAANTAMQQGGGAQNGNAANNGGGNPPAVNGNPQMGANGMNGNGANGNVNAAGGANYNSIYGPFYSMGTGYYGYNSPSAQFQTLYSAAYILANNGQTSACEAVAQAMQAQYKTLVQQLKKAGINASAITDWRQLRIAQAKPVTKISQKYPFSAQSLKGIDVRNLKDKVIGSVSNIAYNSKTGNIGYLVVARGGFLGIGDEYIGVPWSAFSATPGLNVLVLDATQQQLANGPQINPDAVNNRGYFKKTAQRVRQYWKNQQQSSAKNAGGQNGGMQNQNSNAQNK